MSDMAKRALAEAAEVSFAGYRPHEVHPRFIEALTSTDMMLSMRAVHAYPELTLHFIENVLNQARVMGHNQPADIDRTMAAGFLAKNYGVGTLAHLVVQAEMMHHMKDPLNHANIYIIPTAASKRIVEILRQTPLNARDEVLTPRTIVTLLEGGGVMEDVFALLPAGKRMERLDGCLGLLADATQQGKVRTVREPMINISLLRAATVMNSCDFYGTYYTRGMTFEYLADVMEQSQSQSRLPAPKLDIEL